MQGDRFVEATDTADRAAPLCDREVAGPRESGFDFLQRLEALP